MSEDRNGDKKSDSTHFVEVIDNWLLGRDDLAPEIEQAYIRLSDRAKKEDSLIVSVVQTIHPYVRLETACVLVVLTAQRINREDFERQQRMAQFGGGQRR